MKANIATAFEIHQRECHEPASHRRIGDVRRCRHGRIQEVRISELVSHQGYTYGYVNGWQTLIALTPRWWRARRALRKEGQ